MKNRYDWWFLTFDNAKAHLVPAELKDELIQNMEHRGHKVCDGPGVRKTDEGGISRGGAKLATDIRMRFELPGLAFHVYATDVKFFLDSLRDAELRLELRTVYYKLHGDLQCICLLPEIKDELERLLTARLEEANAIRNVKLRALNKARQNIDRQRRQRRES